MVFVDIEAVAAAALCKAFGDFAVLVQLEEVCIIIDSRDKIKITVHGLLRPTGPISGIGTDRAASNGGVIGKIECEGGVRQV